MLWYNWERKRDEYEQMNEMQWSYAPFCDCPFLTTKGLKIKRIDLAKVKISRLISSLGFERFVFNVHIMRSLLGSVPISLVRLWDPF
jgi:hypothetical protein